MITEQDLQAAIAECKGERNPNANTCVKLAAYYILMEHLYPSEVEQTNDIPAPYYSYATEPENHAEPTIDYYSDTEFSEAVDGRAVSEIMPIIDELMSVLQATNPRLYAGVMRKIEQ